MMATQNIRLHEHISLRRVHGDEMNFLDLNRCLKQPYSIDEISNPNTITGISLSCNYLNQMPNFVATLTNLIEFNASHNELNNAEFLLHIPINDNEQTESYWNEKFLTKSNDQQAKFVQNKSHRKLSENHVGTVPNSSSSFLLYPHLEHVNLSYNHIKFLPFNIHILHHLHSLDLSYNYLDELPSDIGYLTELSELNLDHNQLSILPTSLTRLKNLTYLNIAHNHLRSIDTIKNLLHLKYFNLNNNPLEYFPSLLGTCSNLEEFHLVNVQLNRMKNNITWQTFKQFFQLKRIDLSGNNLDDTMIHSLFDCFVRLQHLEDLNLKNNQITTLPPTFLTKMKALRLLDLSANSLTIVPECSSSLEILRLSHNNIDLNPEHCLYLRHIVELELDSNQITNIPNEIVRCHRLESLNLSANPLMKFPATLSQLRSLSRLDLSHCQIQFLPSPEHFTKYFYRTLNSLDLSHNRLCTSMKELIELKVLQDLNLSNNQLYELDMDFRLFTCLQSLKLSNNKFTKYPLCLYQISKDPTQKYLGEILHELYLNGNQLVRLPDEIIHMVNLQTFDLSDNRFPSFPEVITFLEQLTSLSYSQQYGIRIHQLPDDFINLRYLKKLVLAHNSFFEIPDAIYDLLNLEYFDISHNLLNGLQTNRLDRLENLKLFNLNSNNFSAFPSALYRLRQLHWLDMRNNPTCTAPPNDLCVYEQFSEINNEECLSIPTNMFLTINDQREQTLFRVYSRILVDYLPKYDIDRLLIRLKLSDTDIDHFRNEYVKVKREEKIEMLLNKWKEKRDSLANAETLFKLMKFIADEKIIEQMQRVHILAQTIRI